MSRCTLSDLPYDFGVARAIRCRQAAGMESRRSPAGTFTRRVCARSSRAVVLAAWLALAGCVGHQGAGGPTQGGSAAARACAPDNGGITLPDGFCATVFADRIGHARNLVVSPSGVVYVNTWSGRYYGNDKPPSGGFLVALRDTTGSGVADQIVRFGESADSGGTGEQESPSTMGRFTPRSTIGSYATSYRQTLSRRPPKPRRSCRTCPSPATIRCTPS